MSDLSIDSGTPRPNVSEESSRPLHDRELPVSPATEREPVHRLHGEAPDAELQESTRAGSSDPSNSTPEDAEPLSEDVVKLALRRVKDPELNLNILDLGLVYAIRVEGNDVAIDMTLTSPGCPSGPEIMTDAERHLKALPGVGNVSVNLVWSPFWSPDRIEPRVRAYLGF